MESRLHHCHGGPPPPGWLAGYPPPRDGWLGRSASALSKLNSCTKGEVIILNSPFPETVTTPGHATPFTFVPFPGYLASSLLAVAHSFVTDASVLVSHAWGNLPPPQPVHQANDQQLTCHQETPRRTSFFSFISAFHRQDQSTLPRWLALVEEARDVASLVRDTDQHTHRNIEHRRNNPHTNPIIKDTIISS